MIIIDNNWWFRVFLVQKTHSKTYTEAEEEFRMKIYLENRQRIASHNSRHQSGEVSFGMAMNKYGDLVQALHSLSSLEIYLIEFILICSSVTNLLLCWTATGATALAEEDPNSSKPPTLKSPNRLIGAKAELSPPLKIKDSADPAGLSPL